MKRALSRAAKQYERIGLEGVLFGFELLCKPEQVGDVNVIDFWMDVCTLYGQRKRAPANLQPMADYFWRRCGVEGTFREADLQETYLLARLCPYVRGTAAQAVLTDARLSRWEGKRWARTAAELDRTLAGLAHARRRHDRELSMRQFHKKTA